MKKTWMNIVVLLVLMFHMISTGNVAYAAVSADTDQPVNGPVIVTWNMEQSSSEAEYGYCKGTVNPDEAVSAWDNVTHVSEPRVELTENGNYTFFVKDSERVWVETFTLSLIDNTAPKISVTIIDNSGENVTFTVKVNDANGIIDKRILKGQHGVDMYESAEIISSDTISREPGIYTLYAKDIAGNISVSEILVESQVEQEQSPSVSIETIKYESNGTVSAKLNVSTYIEVRCIDGEHGTDVWDGATNENDLNLNNYSPGRYTLLVKTENGTIWPYPLILHGDKNAVASSDIQEESNEWSTEYQEHGARMKYQIESTESPTEPTKPDPSNPPTHSKPTTQNPIPSTANSPTIPERTVTGSITVLPQTGGIDGRAISTIFVIVMEVIGILTVVIVSIVHKRKKKG